MDSGLIPADSGRFLQEWQGHCKVLLWLQVLKFFSTVFLIMHKVTTSTQAFVTPLSFYYAYTLQNKIYEFAASSNKILFSRASHSKYVDSQARWLHSHNISDITK